MKKARRQKGFISGAVSFSDLCLEKTLERRFCGRYHRGILSYIYIYLDHRITNTGRFCIQYYIRIIPQSIHSDPIIYGHYCALLYHIDGNIPEVLLRTVVKAGKRARYCGLNKEKFLRVTVWRKQKLEKVVRQEKKDLKTCQLRMSRYSRHCSSQKIDNYS